MEFLIALSFTMVVVFGYELYNYLQDRSAYAKSLDEAANREKIRQQMLLHSETYQERGNKLEVSNTARDVGVLQAEQVSSLRVLNNIVDRLETRIRRMTSYTVVLVLSLLATALV